MQYLLSKHILDAEIIIFQNIMVHFFPEGGDILFLFTAGEVLFELVSATEVSAIFCFFLF